MMWILKAQTEDDARTFRVRAGGIKTIGRATRADFIMDAPLVSRLHCRLEATADGLEVTDLSSTNGTFVNGRRIERARLKDGDRLRVGRVELSIERRGR
jgi:pSer/pThr/pTyr-binding forkhead associated (FHA) protein